MSKSLTIKSIITALFLVAIMIIFSNRVDAASASLTASSTEVNVGEQVTVKGTVTAGGWHLVLSGAGQTKTLIGTTNQISNETASESITFTATEAGNYTFTLTGDYKDFDAADEAASEKCSKTLTVKAVNNSSNNDSDNNNQTPSENNSTNTTTKKSSNANLKNLGITPNDFKGFKNTQLSYDVEIPNDVAKVKVYATASDSKAKVEGTGNVTLKEGKNVVNVKVTAEDGTTKTFTINITRKAKEETSNSDIAEISLKDPEKPVETSENEEENNQEIGLKSLTIKNLNLNPTFDSKTYEYTVGLIEDLNSIEIEAIPNSEEATVEIIGNENLEQGENVITILVSNKDKEEFATYQIVVNKNVISEEIVGSVNWLKPSTWGMKQKIVVGIVIILIIAIIVMIVLKIKLKNNYEDDIDFPGAEELDKALTEHQGLSEDDELKPQEELKDNDETTNMEIEEENINDYREPGHLFDAYSKKKGKHF